MHVLFDAAFEIQTLLEKQGWKFCFIGGLAVQKWGQARVTNDIDLTVLTGFGHEEKFIDTLLAHFKARTPNARTFAIHHRILLMTNNAGIGIDVSCGGYPFEEQAVRRARKVQFVPGIRLRVCTAEDLIVLKAFANRAIDWFDIEGVIVKQRKRKLDLQYVFNQLGPLALLKEEPEILPKLQALIDECE